MKPDLLNRIADLCESVVEKQFKKLGYSVKRLDRQKGRPRPEFLVSRSGRPQLLCEVKTIFSAGYLRDKGFHMSSLDENRRSYTLYRKDLRLTHIDDRVADAVRKRAALVADEPNLAKLPLLVAFFFDVFADHLHLYPRTFDKEVSGILTIKRDDATIKAFEQLSPAERERRLFDPKMGGWPAYQRQGLYVSAK